MHRQGLTGDFEQSKNFGEINRFAANTQAIAATLGQEYGCGGR
jgi:hypothetical protein